MRYYKTDIFVHVLLIFESYNTYSYYTLSNVTLRACMYNTRIRYEEIGFMQATADIVLKHTYV